MNDNWELQYGKIIMDKNSVYSCLHTYIQYVNTSTINTSTFYSIYNNNNKKKLK